MGDDPFFRTGAQARPPRNSTTLRPSASRAIFPAPIRTDTGFGNPRCSFCLDPLAAQHSIQTMAQPLARGTRRLARRPNCSCDAWGWNPFGAD